jgi:hypothetical protein
MVVLFFFEVRNFFQRRSLLLLVSGVKKPGYASAPLLYCISEYTTSKEKFIHE